MKAAEARGPAIDHLGMQREDDYARVIPCPRRREEPKNRVLRPVPMQPGRTCEDGPPVIPVDLRVT